MEVNTPFVVVDASAEKTCIALGVAPERETAIHDEIQRIGESLPDEECEEGRLVNVANQVAKNLGLNANELFLLGISMGHTIGYSHAMESVMSNITSGFKSMFGGDTESESEILPGTQVGEA